MVDTEIRSSSWQDNDEILRKLHRLRYFPVDIPLVTNGHRSVTFFKENTSTLVEISLQGVQGPEVIRLL